MKIKICGMREAGNLSAIAGLNPDYLGFIFYEKSSRCVREVLDPAHVRGLPVSIGRVGVFVDELVCNIQKISISYGLDCVQLHGSESPEVCQQVRELGLCVLKSFAVGSSFDFGQLAAYAPVCDFFLFDTKGDLPGGNGRAFDWQLLRTYQGPVPFFLSGGLGPDNLTELLDFQHPLLYGLDFNSQLETAPGHKDAARTRGLLARLRAPKPA